MGDVGRFHFLGFIVSSDSYMNRWEVILPAEEGKLEVSYCWFRTCKDAEVFCLRKKDRSTLHLSTAKGKSSPDGNNKGKQRKHQFKDLIIEEYRNLPANAPSPCDSICGLARCFDARL